MSKKLIKTLLCLGLVALNINTAHAITATVTNTFSAGQKIVASQVNTNFNDVLAAINGQLASENILDGGIATIDLADLLVTAAKLSANAVTTAKINDAAVTNAKLASLNYASSTSVNYSNTGITATPIASKTITAIGRPIVVRMVNSQGINCSPTGLLTNNIFASSVINTGTGSEAAIELRKNGATVTVTNLRNSGGTQGKTCAQIMDYVDTNPGSGSITYELRGFADAGQTISVCNCAIYVQEL